MMACAPVHAADSYYIKMRSGFGSAGRFKR